MDDNKNLNQPNATTPNNDDYQKILDEYAASIKPEENSQQDTTSTPKEDMVKLESVKEEPAEENSEEQLSLKSMNSLQLEASEPEVVDTKFNIEAPIINQPTETLPPEPQTTETKTPEEIKSQIDKIFADDSSSSNDSSSTSFPPSKTNTLAKNFFFLSIAIFFLVAAGWIYFLYFYQQPTNNTNVSTVSPTPTEIVSEETCELNGTTYKVGKSFKSADGCNTCSCQTGNTITCTEMACNISPVITPVATKSATTKVTLTPTKKVPTATPILDSSEE